MKKMLVNLLLMLASLAAVLLLFEYGVFRYLLPASDMPRAVTIDEVVRLSPGQTGTFRVMDDLAARFRINAQGWNSGHADYDRQKTPGTLRIALIGDSYVEGLRVDYRKSMAEQLESLLGPGHEVYRFGISGAPLSQYLHMLRREVMAYQPDVVAVLLIHNDFKESYAFKPGTRTSSFMKLDMDGDKVRGELVPGELPCRWYDPLRNSATWRYLSIRRGLRFAALRSLILGEDKAALSPPSKQPALQGNIDISRLEETTADPLSQDRAATRYILQEMQALTNASGARLVLLMDGVRSIIESGSPAVMDYSRGALRLNKMVRTVAGELGIPFLDLHPVFVADFGQNKHPFAFPHDGHWNEYANALAADGLMETLKAHAIVHP